MLEKTTIQYLKNLKNNNNRDWFEGNRDKYTAAKSDFEVLVASIIQYLGKKNEQYNLLKPKDCIFRINRDVRFSKDKSPYKNNFGAAFQIGGKKSANAGYYIHVEPGNSFVGGGIWMPEAEQLKKIRQEIDYNFNHFKKIISSKKFIDTYKELDKEGALSKPPKGYESNNEAIEYLKLKNFVTGVKVSDAQWCNTTILKEIKSYFDILTPLIIFLNEAVKKEQ